MKKLFTLLFLLITFSTAVYSQQPVGEVPSKSVTKSKLREMETDRPDVSESPRTIDAGHFQFESDLFRLETQHESESRNREYLINQANLKFGITKSTAVQLSIQSYNITKETATDGSTETSHGIGDLTLRIKQNLLGNDEGKFAIAILPYVKFPTSVADAQSQYEGGLIIPMSFNLGKEWKMGMQVEADRVQDEEGKGHHNELLQTLTVSHPVVKHLDAILETYYTYAVKEKHFNNFLNAAVQYEIGSDVMIDGGVNYGLQHDAKRSYFLGLSFRL